MKGTSIQTACGACALAAAAVAGASQARSASGRKLSMVNGNENDDQDDENDEQQRRGAEEAGSKVMLRVIGASRKIGELRVGEARDRGLHLHRIDLRILHHFLRFRGCEEPVQVLDLFLARRGRALDLLIQLCRTNKVHILIGGSGCELDRGLGWLLCAQRGRGDKKRTEGDGNKTAREKREEPGQVHGGSRENDWGECE